MELGALMNNIVLQPARGKVLRPYSVTSRYMVRNCRFIANDYEIQCVQWTGRKRIFSLADVSEIRRTPILIGRLNGTGRSALAERLELVASTGEVLAWLPGGVTSPDYVSPLDSLKYFRAPGWWDMAELEAFAVKIGVPITVNSTKPYMRGLLFTDLASQVASIRRPRTHQ